MLTKFNKFEDVSGFISDTIYSYIKDNYYIDMKESAIDKEKDGDCTFKTVLKRDVDGVECKAVITLCEKDTIYGKSFTFHKVDSVGDTKWGEETRAFESSCNVCSSKDDHVHKADNTNTCSKNLYVKDTYNTKANPHTEDENDVNWVIENRDRLKRILTKNGCDCSWISKYTKPVESKRDAISTEDTYDEDSLVKLIRYLFGC